MNLLGRGGGLPNGKHFMGEEQDMIHAKGQWNVWKAEAEKALKGKSVEFLNSATYEGITLKPLYTEADSDFEQRFSGDDHRTTNDWIISQALFAEDSKKLSEKIVAAKKRGQHSFYLKNFSFLNNKQDAKLAFQQIDWEQDSIFFDIGEELGIISLFLHERLEKNELQTLKGTLGFDPYESLLRNGKSTLSLQTQLDYLADTIKWCQVNKCNVRCLLIQGSLYHEAGAHSLQELIYTFSHALDIVNELLNRGISIDVIAKNISFSFAVGSVYFMEIAKLRAAKQIWASLIHALGGSEPSQKIYLHTMTSAFNKTRNDVYVNLLRTTTEGFSAAVAGVDELTILPFDSVLSDTGEIGERIARNAQFILKEESLLSKVVDPAGGSFYVESLTTELAERAWKEIQEIDEKGGFLNELIAGTPQKRLEIILEKRRADLNHGNKIVIGTNAFANLSEQMTVTKEVKMKEKNRQQAELVCSFQEAVLVVREKAVLPNIKSLGEEKELQIQPLKQSRLVEHFEQLRTDAQNYFQKKGDHPKAVVINFGCLKDYKPSLDFVTGVLATGGVTAEAISYDQFQSISNEQVIIFCGKDEDYQSIHSSFITKLKTANKKAYLYIYGAGHEKKVKEFGFKGFLSPNMNAYTFLVTLHHKLGVRNG